MKRKIGNRIRAIFTAPDQSEAERLLKAFISDYEKSAPKLADWAETALPEGFTVFAVGRQLLCPVGDN